MPKRILFAAVLSTFAAAALGAEREPPLPEPVDIDTRDGVTLRGTYYPPTTPVRAPIAVLLGDQGESRAMLEPLALSLQTPHGTVGDRQAEKKDRPTPWAVLTVDLRGQGDSVRGRTPTGERRDLGGVKLSRQTLTAMVKQDLEAVRRFLVAKNDAGEINLNRMAYVGVGMGALVATNAAAVDWSVLQLNTGKQGQDVKALALVSPPWSLKGVGVLNALRQPGVQSEVAVMLLYGGDDRKSASAAERIYKQLAKGRPEMPAPTRDDLPALLDVGGPSKMRGSAWLKEAGRDAERLIGQFLQQHVAGPEFAWTKRRLD